MRREQRKYAEYLRAQVRELLTEYGKVDILWFDFSYPKPDGSGKGRQDWDSENLLKMIRELQPHVILDDRLDLQDTPGAWDIKTPEQFQPREWVKVNGQPVVWEACQTFSGSWGYHRDEQTWRSVDELLRTLIDCVAKGGNLLLNVGPTGRGEFDYRALDRLSGIGQWMRQHSRAIYGCTQAPDDIPTPQDCRLTYNPQTGSGSYVHCFVATTLHLDRPTGAASVCPTAQRRQRSRHTRRATGAKQNSAADRKTLTLNLPTIKPNVTIGDRALPEGLERGKPLPRSWNRRSARAQPGLPPYPPGYRRGRRAPGEIPPRTAGARRDTAEDGGLQASDVLTRLLRTPENQVSPPRSPPRYHSCFRRVRCAEALASAQGCR